MRPSQKMVGADPGNLFVQYETKDQAERAMGNMQDRNYDERSIKLYFIPDLIYEGHFKPQSTTWSETITTIAIEIHFFWFSWRDSFMASWIIASSSMLL